MKMYKSYLITMISLILFSGTTFCIELNHVSSEVPSAVFEGGSNWWKGVKAYWAPKIPDIIVDSQGEAHWTHNEENPIAIPSIVENNCSPIIKTSSKANPFVTLLVVAGAGFVTYKLVYCLLNRYYFSKNRTKIVENPEMVLQY